MKTHSYGNHELVTFTHLHIESCSHQINYSLIREADHKNLIQQTKKYILLKLSLKPQVKMQYKKCV